MDPSSLELFLKHSMMLDAFGVIGLGLLGLAAIRLARRYQSWGGNLLASGAICVLVARLYIVLAPHFMSLQAQEAIGAVGISLSIALPPLLLTFGLAGIVWGLWGHQRWLKQILR